jgi:hypothetical protein
MCAGFWWGNLKESSHLEDLGIGGTCTKISCSFWDCCRCSGDVETQRAIEPGNKTPDYGLGPHKLTNLV